MSAVWEAYDRYAAIKDINQDDRETMSWLYDAACLLEIAIHDERLLSIHDEYYKDMGLKLPWNESVHLPSDGEEPINYERLFEIWADFADDEAPAAVTELIDEKGLGAVDAVSFMAFCYGWRKALQTMEELKK
jgi:hypothetical protein